MRRHGFLRRTAHVAEAVWQGTVFALAGSALGTLSLRRQLAFQASRAKLAVLDYEAHDFVMSVTCPKDLTRTRACAKEPETVAWLQANLQPGDAFFDVGANVGAYSLIAAKLVGVEGQVVAFEPGAPSYASLVRNLGLNGIENVVPLPIGLSDATGLIELSFPSGLPGETVCAAGEPAVLVCRVLAYRLDDAVALLSLRCPKLLKIDTDGFELAALMGAPESLANPVLRGVLFEEYPGSPKAVAIHALLSAAGFGEARVVSRGHGRVANHIYERR